MNAPLTPAAIRQLDAGAEFLGYTKNGHSVWHIVYSPPSGIERDLAYVYENGVARKATEADAPR